MLFSLQAQDNVMNLPLTNGWGEKHRLFVKWKYIEAKVVYYFFCVYFKSSFLLFTDLANFLYFLICFPTLVLSHV